VQIQVNLEQIPLYKQDDRRIRYRGSENVAAVSVEMGLGNVTMSRKCVTSRAVTESVTKPDPHELHNQ
jgi:hypothetical protein